MKRIAADPRQTGNHLFRSFPSGEGNISLELRQLSTSTASSRQPSPDWADPLTLPLYTISGLLPTTCYQNRLQTSSCKLLTLLRSLLLHTSFCKLTNALQCSIFKKTSLVLPPQSCGVFSPAFVHLPIISVAHVTEGSKSMKHFCTDCLAQHAAQWLEACAVWLHIGFSSDGIKVGDPQPSESAQLSSSHLDLDHPFIYVL